MIMRDDHSPRRKRLEDQGLLGARVVTPEEETEDAAW